MAEVTQNPALLQLNGKALRFDLSLLSHETEIADTLRAVIADAGGRLAKSNNTKKSNKHTVVLYGDNCDEDALREFHQLDFCVCLHWHWVIACHEHNRVLGPTDNNYMGFRYAVNASSPSASVSTLVDEATRGESSKSPPAEQHKHDSTATPPPPPPKAVHRNSWFGNEYTDADYTYLKDYIVYYHKTNRDPAEKSMFVEMTKRAPHHTWTQWRRFYERNTQKLVDEVPELRQYYDVIQTSKTTPVPDSARARAARATAWKSYEETISEQKQLSESERTALVNLVANAPEGVSLEELLQQFSHDHPNYPARYLSKVIEDNRSSFDRALERRQRKVAARAERRNKSSPLHRPVKGGNTS